MGVEANPITITWIAGLALSAFTASALLINERTRAWPDRRIIVLSVAMSFSFVLSLLRISGKI